ncbi:MAG: class I SAM-dependent RNA methyltransferase [Clostridia bacterium]|nr:class I SAM-dependent RNA methyltransferase [Clostridia bacterium]
MKKYKISVTTASGVEAVTKRELRDLGIENAPAISGRLSFEGTALDVARCNMFLRTADRVYIEVGRFPCTNFDQLFEGVSKLDWKSFLPVDASFPVNGKCVGSVLYGVSACQSIIKKSIVVALKKAYRVAEILEDGSEYRIEFTIIKDEAVLYIDTSGSPLHKRGYRNLVGAAPMKETLAAAIILLSVWRYNRPFIDPFCGSGTLAIEAAMIGLDKAPGLCRTFAYEWWDNFPQEAKDKARSEAKERVKKDRTLQISAFDIDKNAIRLAEHHAKNAGVYEYIHFQCMDMREVKSSKAYGVVITNPPYGERLLSEKELRLLYQDFQKVYKNLPDWSLFLITAYGDFESVFGKKADRTRKLYNGDLECRLYQYLGKKPKDTNLITGDKNV